MTSLSSHSSSTDLEPLSLHASAVLCGPDLYTVIDRLLHRLLLRTPFEAAAALVVDFASSDGAKYETLLLEEDTDAWYRRIHSLSWSDSSAVSLGFQRWFPLLGVSHGRVGSRVLDPQISKELLACANSYDVLLVYVILFAEMGILSSVDVFSHVLRKYLLKYDIYDIEAIIPVLSLLTALHIHSSGNVDAPTSFDAVTTIRHSICSVCDWALDVGGADEHLLLWTSKFFTKTILILLAADVGESALRSVADAFSRAVCGLFTKDETLLSCLSTTERHLNDAIDSIEHPYSASPPGRKAPVDRSDPAALLKKCLDAIAGNPSMAIRLVTCLVHDLGGADRFCTLLETGVNESFRYLIELERIVNPSTADAFDRAVQSLNLSYRSTLLACTIVPTHFLLRHTVEFRGGWRRAWINTFRLLSTFESRRRGNSAVAPVPKRSDASTAVVYSSRRPASFAHLKSFWQSSVGTAPSAKSLTGSADVCPPWSELIETHSMFCDEWLGMKCSPCDACPTRSKLYKEWDQYSSRDRLRMAMDIIHVMCHVPDMQRQEAISALLLCYVEYLLSLLQSQRGIVVEDSNRFELALVLSELLFVVCSADSASVLSGLVILLSSSLLKSWSWIHGASSEVLHCVKEFVIALVAMCCEGNDLKLKRTLSANAVALQRRTALVLLLQAPLAVFPDDVDPLANVMRNGGVPAPIVERFCARFR